MKKWLPGLLLIASGCIHETTMSGNPFTPFHSVMWDYTHSTKSIGIEKVKYQTSVTYKAAAVREAYVNEYARKYELNEEAKAEMLKKELEEAGQFDTFLIAHYATDKDTAKITQETKVWNLTLNGQLAESVVSLKANDTVLRFFYPYITPWSNVYVAKFKKQDDAAPKELKMTGVVDHLSFLWRNK